MWDTSGHPPTHGPPEIVFILKSGSAHIISHEYVDINIKFQYIIYNTTPVILLKKILHVGHVRPPPDTWTPRNNFYLKLFI